MSFLLACSFFSLPLSRFTKSSLEDLEELCFDLPFSALSLSSHSTSLSSSQAWLGLNGRTLHLLPRPCSHTGDICCGGTPAVPPSVPPGSRTTAARQRLSGRTGMSARWLCLPYSRPQLLSDMGLQWHHVRALESAVHVWKKHTELVSSSSLHISQGGVDTDEKTEN